MISNSKLKYNYTVRTDKIKDEDGEIHTVYGINLYVGNALIKEIPDIFFRPESANEFIFLCNKLKLDEEKLLYLIDFILGRIV